MLDLFSFADKHLSPYKMVGDEIRVQTCPFCNGGDSEDDTGCGALRVVSDCAHWAPRAPIDVQLGFPGRNLQRHWALRAAGDGRGRRGAAADGKR